jgi:mannose-6-phosphate isomerase-like protein (cupin superfamily)
MIMMLPLAQLVATLDGMSYRARLLGRAKWGKLQKSIPHGSQSRFVETYACLLLAPARSAGPLRRAHGGIADIGRDPPHGGELHPDGDELIYVISGKVRVVGESAPHESCELGPGGACIVSKGEWHCVRILEPTRLLHITPGPQGDHRPIGASRRP